MFERRSPLARQLGAGGVDGLDGRRALRLSEVRGWELAQVGVFPGGAAAVAAALAPVLGVDALAAGAGVGLQAPAATLYRIATDAYWVVTTQPKVISQLGGAVPGTAGSVTALSHSRVRLAVQGPQARFVLARGVSVDLHPRSFAVGAFAQTALHHTGVLLARSAPERYELFVLRTFALSIWEWLLDAALPVGYEIAVEQVPPPDDLRRAGDSAGPLTDS